MPPCSFCGGKVLPANIVKGERKHAVCAHCRQVLDEYMEARVQEYLPEQIKEALSEDNYDKVFGDKIREIMEAGNYKMAFEDKWDTIIANTIKAEVSGAVEELVKEKVAEALKSGLSALVSGARPLARGKKPSDSKTSQEGV